MGETISRWVLACLVMVVAPGVAWRAQAVGTAFTYQGQVQISGSPASGACDLQFSLFPVVSGGSQVGSTLTQNNVTVTNGVFTLQLDFGASAFDGTDRFLQLAARCPTGSGSFNTLSPRQQVTATPYALFSQNIADAAITTTKLSSNAVGTAQLQDNSVTSAKIVDGTITSADVGFNFAGSSSKGGAASDLACSTCVDATEVSATGSATGQVLTSNGSAVSWQNQVGFTLPSVQSGSNAGPAFSITNTKNASAATGVNGYAPAGGDGILGQSDRADGNGVRGIATGASGIGLVGLNLTPGTGVPYAEAAGSGVFGYSHTGSIGVMGESDKSTGKGVRGSSPSGTGVQGDTLSGTGVAGYSSSGTGVYGFTNNGIVGVYGESDSSTGNSGVTGVSLSALGFGVNGQSTNGSGVNGHTVNGPYGVYGQTDKVFSNNVVGAVIPAGVEGVSQSAFGVMGLTNSQTGVVGCSGNANVCFGTGLNVSYPPSNTGVYGRGGSTGVDGDSANGVGVQGTGDFGVSGGGSNIGVYAHNTTSGIAAYLATPSVAADLYGDVSVHGNLSATGDLNASGRLRGSCFNVTPLPVAFNCLDLAETFASATPTEPGDLVVLDSSAGDTMVHLAARPYESALVGIVSAAPAIVFDRGRATVGGDSSDLITATRTTVGIAGRVPVKFSVENGPVAVGDALTSSSTVGTAMRASKVGKIVGYALESAGSDGKVLTWLQPGQYLPPKLVDKLNRLLADDE